MNAVAQPLPDGAPAEIRLPDIAVATTERPFEFTGDAREFFRIWIVNLALSIVTLGIYSAWSKVRTQRYFYANTRVAGAPFEYLAKPIPILKGRLIAFVLFGSYVVSGHISASVQLGMLAFIALIAPWLIVRGARFRARYSAWRSIPFSFVGRYGQAYVNYLLLYVFVVLSAGIYQPFLKARQKRYVVTNHRYGGDGFEFHIANDKFFPPYLKAVGLIIVWYIVTAVFAALLMSVAYSHQSAHPPATWPLYASVGLGYFGLFGVTVYVATRVNNLMYNAMELRGNRLRSSLRARDLIGIYLVNTLAILCSVGMLVPWAMIRLARYRASQLILLDAGNLDDFTATSTTEESAAASELDAVFDIDVGF